MDKIKNGSDIIESVQESCGKIEAKIEFADDFPPAWMAFGV